MPLNIKDAETDRLVRELAAVTGETITGAVATAVEERLQRVRGVARAPAFAEELLAIGRRCASLPVQDDRPADEIVGYDAGGVSR